MTNACVKWKEQLLEAALTGTAAGDLEEHMKTCAACAAELEALQARRERMDAMLPLVARGAELPGEFRARVVAAAEAESEQKRARSVGRWVLVGATAVVTAALVMGLLLHWRAAPTTLEAELSAAERLAEWRAPSDVLLQTPGQEILQTTPRLGESYMKVPINTEEE
ncbi:MAG: hypothetical protein DMG29_09540 [Acidobacteria bacterium]|nr:MAG: hypothetical protein DMG29_09540 [Acidobacteriota bacterium]